MVRAGLCLSTLLTLLAGGSLRAEGEAWPHFAHPSWSRQGDRIALDCGPGGKLDLCLLEVATGKVIRLTATEGVQEAVPVFSPDGEQLSFSRESEGVWRLAVLTLRTMKVSELAELDMPYASSSTWLPDGSRLFFDKKNAQGDHDIFGVDPDGRSLELLIGGPNSQRFPALSPDGTQLAYTELGEGAGDIYLAAVDGSGRRRLTTHPADEGVPVWSPDGQRLSFYRNVGDNIEVFVTDLDGNERRITEHPSTDIFGPFAPDGRSLVFESNRDRDPSGFDKGADLYRVDLETLAVERLTEPARFPPASAVVAPGDLR